MALAAAALCSTAFAGHKSSQSVIISSNPDFANGDAGYVHNTADDVQYIMCRINGGTGTCYARAKSGVTRSCTTTNANLLNAIRFITSESYIYFRWDSDGICTAVNVENGSVGRPKEY